MKVKKRKVCIGDRLMRVPIIDYNLPLSYNENDIVKANGVEKRIKTLNYSSIKESEFGNYYGIENVKNGVWDYLYECEIDKS